MLKLSVGAIRRKHDAKRTVRWGRHGEKRCQQGIHARERSSQVCPRISPNGLEGVWNISTFV
eukprot:2090664-Rhodomonas_salina.3